MIVHRGSKWCVRSRSKSKKTGRRRNLGCYRTKKQALARERQIQFFKHRR